DRGRVKPPPLSPVNNRKFLGDLIFTVSSARRRDSGNNSRQYEIGQVLEFGDTPSQTVEPMFVGPVTDIQHNTNMLDYDTMGVSTDEQALISDQSLKAHLALTQQLNTLKSKRADAEVTINTQQ